MVFIFCKCFAFIFYFEFPLTTLKETKLPCLLFMLFANVITICSMGTVTNWMNHFWKNLAVTKFSILTVNSKMF